MFNNLIESKPVKQRSFAATVFSVIFHGAIIAGSVMATKQVVQAVEDDAPQKVDFVEIKKDQPPPPEEAPPPDVAAPPPIAKGFQVLAAPVNIPDVIPEIDLNKALTNEDDFSGKGVAGGMASGVVGGVVVNQDQTYFDFQVEKAVASAPGSQAPRYTDILRSAGVEGKVTAQFEVDTTGRVIISSFRVISSDHAMFEQSLRAALPNMRFIPAEIGGRKVKQLVQQPFVFALQK